VVLFGDEGAPIQCQPAPKYATNAFLFDPCKGWTPHAPVDGPPPRARSSAAYDRDADALFFYGGRFRAGSSGPYTNYGDLWRYDGGSGTWLQLDNGKGGPTARSNAAIGYRRQTQAVVLFGGNTSASGLQYSPQNDTWLYEIAQAKWVKLATKGQAPVPRLFHSAAVSDDGAFLVVVGGGGADALTGSFYDDTWLLNLDTLQWTKAAGPGPKARIKAGFAPAPATTKLWLFGGHDDGSVGNRNDLWIFDTATGGWQNVLEGDKGAGGDPNQTFKPANAFCDFPPDFMQIDKASPERREAMIFSADAKGDLWMFGGKSDCGVLRDVWRYDTAAKVWLNPDDTSIGWSCERYKKPCQTLCN